MLPVGDPLDIVINFTLTLFYKDVFNLIWKKCLSEYNIKCNTYQKSK